MRNAKLMTSSQLDFTQKLPSETDFPYFPPKSFPRSLHNLSKYRLGPERQTALQDQFVVPTKIAACSTQLNRHNHFRRLDSDSQKIYEKSNRIHPFLTKSSFLPKNPISVLITPWPRLPKLHHIETKKAPYFTRLFTQPLSISTLNSSLTFNLPTTLVV